LVDVDARQVVIKDVKGLAAIIESPQ
jgi:hypothetical protein